MKDVGTKFTGEYEITGHSEVTDDDLALLEYAQAPVMNVGGPGSGHFSHESEKGKGPGGSISSKGEGPIGGRKLDPKKVANGKRTHVPQDPVKLAHATANEQLIADQIPRSIHTPDHEPFDVLSKPYAIEVKTLCPGALHPKITMHNDDERQSLDRKWAEAEKNNLDPWTVAIDARAGWDKPVYYIKHGLGSFNLSSMTKTTLAEIKGVFA